MTYRELCIEMGKAGPYMTDVIGKCQRESLTVRRGVKSAAHLFLQKTKTYAAAVSKRDLQSKFSEERQTLGFLVYTEDLATGSIAHYPVAVDELSGIVKQLNDGTCGILDDVIECLTRRTEDGAYIPWVKASSLQRLWSDPELADIEKTSSRHSKYGSIAAKGRRVGQAAFRKAVLELWEGRCALTGLSLQNHLVASPIQRVGAPETTTEIKDDPHNGILLARNVDKAFEDGDISFSNDGKILISAPLSESEISLLGISRKSRLPKIPDRTPRYLTWHRNDHGF